MYLKERVRTARLDLVGCNANSSLPKSYLLLKPLLENALSSAVTISISLNEVQLREGKLPLNLEMLWMINAKRALRESECVSICNIKITFFANIPFYGVELNLRHWCFLFNKKWRPTLQWNSSISTRLFWKDLRIKLNLKVYTEKQKRLERVFV